MIDYTFWDDQIKPMEFIFNNECDSYPVMNMWAGRKEPNQFFEIDIGVSVYIRNILLKNSNNEGNNNGYVNRSIKVELYSKNECFVGEPIFLLWTLLTVVVTMEIQ